MADHSKPTVTSTYANYTSEIDARFDDLALGLDPANTTATNLPTNSIRYSSASNKWQKWNGSTWNDLSSGYAINITGSAGSVEWNNVQNKPSIAYADGNTYNLNISGSAATLTTPRTINGVSFNGSANINVDTVNPVTFNNSGTGDASGTSFNGSLARTISYNSVGAPSTTGTNATGTWGISISGSSASTSGNAATATALQTARTINGVSFNGTANIDVEPYVEQDNTTNANRYVTFVDSSTAGNQRLNLDTDLIYNPSTNTLTCNITGNSASQFPSQTGNTGKFLTTNGTSVSWATVQAGYTFGTPTSLVGQSSVTVSGIPSTATKITATISSASTTNVSNLFLRGGAGSIDSSADHIRFSTSVASGDTSTTAGTAFVQYNANNTGALFAGVAEFTKQNSSNNWMCSFRIAGTGGLEHQSGVSSKAFSGSLDRLEISLSTGTFDAGEITVSYI